jgi:hypothetical protein
MPTTSTTEQPRATDFPARGKVLKFEGRTLVFQPANTNYELRLESETTTDGVPTGVTLNATIRVKARKIWTVPSGGNFIDPIYGPPRKVQGRIKYLDDNQMIVQAGAPVLVSLPSDAEAFDLVRGPLVVGGLVNVSVLPGATIEILKP